jgi:hypothetical protein
MNAEVPLAIASFKMDVDHTSHRGQSLLQTGDTTVPLVGHLGEQEFNFQF